MKKISYIVLLAIAVVLFSCGERDAEPFFPSGNFVVIGHIYTSEVDASGEPIMAQAMVVKNGKYIYVGDSAGAKAYLAADTRVIRHSHGLVMPSCTDGHAHYTMGTTVNLIGLQLTDEDDTQVILDKVAAFYTKTKDEGKSNIFGSGWNYVLLSSSLPTRHQLDSVCPDMALYLNDSEGHKGLANTLCLQQAGILDKEGRLIKSEIVGGKIVLGPDSLPTGLLKEQAGTYVRFHGIDFDELLTPAVARQTFIELQEHILSNGYTMYMDGWSTYFGNDAYYRAAQQMDQMGQLFFNLGLSYEIESWCEDIESAVEEAIQWQRFASKHVHPDYFKLFMDGTVETFTGYLLQPYADGTRGIPNWSQDDLEQITRYANNKGLSMHIHTMGDAAVRCAINAYAAAGQPELRNSIVHVRNIDPTDVQRMADNNITAVAGMLWHSVPDIARDTLTKSLPANIANKAYPMQSFFQHGVNVTSHTDYPATTGSPDNPFGIMQIAITGMLQLGEFPATTPWDADELISRTQFLQAITINGARQMRLERERGSIAVGKYADFILIDQDVLTCPDSQIGQTKVEATYFEGNCVYFR